jgi:hypothetical protein
MDDHGSIFERQGKNEAPRSYAAPKCSLILTFEGDDVAGERLVPHRQERPIYPLLIALGYAPECPLCPAT